MRDTGIRMTLVDHKEWTSDDGRRHRREEWTISGGEIDPSWRRHVGSGEPSSRFTLYVVDGEVDVRLSSYGGVVWPTAWPNLFQAARQGTYQAAVEITDLGIQFRDAALHGASHVYADVNLLP